MELTLLPYESAFLEAFIEWRNRPLSVRHKSATDDVRGRDCKDASDRRDRSLLIKGNPVNEVLYGLAEARVAEWVTGLNPGCWIDDVFFI
jgi:hypothetical protein